MSGQSIFLFLLCGIVDNCLMIEKSLCEKDIWMTLTMSMRHLELIEKTINLCEAKNYCLGCDCPGLNPSFENSWLNWNSK
jgi:hypothetical protein